MKNLCVYCTRTGLTKAAAERFAEITGAELLNITDGKDRGSIFGYISACVESLTNKRPKLLPLKTEFPLSEYGNIIVCAPVWCEDVSILAKSFLEEHGSKIKGEIHVILTHMSKLDYKKSVDKLSKCAGKTVSSFLSVKTKKNDFLAEVNRYAEDFKKSEGA